MAKKRQSFSKDFKAKVTLEALREGAVQKEMGSPNYFKFTREFKSAKI